MLNDWAKRAVARRPIEARIVRKVVKALKDAGDPVVQVYDTEEYVDVKTKDEVLNEVFNLDEAYLITKSGGWVRLIMGQDWDTVCDYTMSLDEALEPVMQYVMNEGV